MRTTIVGSGTLLPDHRHRSPGHLLETSNAKVLLDCGSGVVHGLSSLEKDWGAISHVAISHFHADHFCDLPALLWAWTHGVAPEARIPRVLLGPVGLGHVLQGLAQAYGDFVQEPGAPLEVVELRGGDAWELDESGSMILAHRTRHTAESLAFRVEADGCVVGYTGDTGPYPPLGVFLRAVDVLICECAVTDDAGADNHLSPTGVAALLTEAQPRRVVLTHIYPEVDRDELVDVLRASGFEGDVEVGWDGLVSEF